MAPPLAHRRRSGVCGIFYEKGIAMHPTDHLCWPHLTPVPDTRLDVPTLWRCALGLALVCGGGVSLLCLLCLLLVWVPAAWSAPPTYQVQLFDNPTPQVLPFLGDLDEDDTAVGERYQLGRSAALRVTTTTTTVLAPLSPQGYSSAAGISHGYIIGWADDVGTATGPGTGRHAVYWAPDGTIHALPNSGAGPPGGGGADMVSPDLVVGSVNTPQIPGLPPHAQDRQVPAVWRQGVLHVLPALGTEYGAVTAVSASGVMVGISGGFSGLSSYQATMWLFDQPLALAPPDSHASGLNDAGEVVGTATFAQGRHAFLWAPSTGLLDLGTLPGHSVSGARSINTAGLIVGASGRTDGTQAAVLWEERQPYDLEMLISTAGVVLTSAIAINDHGHILAYGTLDGEPQNFLLIPTTPGIPVPPVALIDTVQGDFNGDGLQDLAGRDAQYSVWLCLSGEPQCTHIGGWLFQLVAGDLDGDGRDDLAGLGWGYTIWAMTDGQHFTQLPGQLHTLVIGDFYGDGHAHLAGLWGQTLWRAPRVGWWEWLPGTLTTLVAGDFDGDGRDDLAGIAPGYYSWVHTASGWHWSPGFVYTMHAVKNTTAPDTLIGAWGFCLYQLTTALVWQTQACEALQVSR